MAMLTGFESAPPAPLVPVPPDERQVIARAQRGDTAAFRVLVESHRARAYALALRVLRSGADAEEVAQDAFVKAWAALPTFRGDASFSTWLHRIVWRRALDRLAEAKARRRREEAVAADAPLRAAPEHESGGAAEPFAERLLEALSPQQRAAVVLFYFEDRSIAQAAMVMGLPENTFKTHLHRARAALREAWRQQRSEER
ncbi:MAG: RNA polymerase sigma factor [Candidatus Eisenbacteria bacterium]|uniref:RNA polymerase sigma factor n=1 Tax=Eiseniibacteriota bacterium TaxID=2212470 RepID=A0A933W133_UNCEI|nr:RNA polymerase sigma factor [Candidatus Eisenbacteria bacterium]